MNNQSIAGILGVQFEIFGRVTHSVLMVFGILFGVERPLAFPESSVEVLSDELLKRNGYKLVVGQSRIAIRKIEFIEKKQLPVQGCIFLRLQPSLS
jgi:hypothetical protein